MDSFIHKDGELFAEDVRVADLAEKYGTPLFIYSRSHIQHQYRALTSALHEIEPLICYSVKVNTNAAVINTLAAEGSGADVVSVGELVRARLAGVPASRIVFAGVGKTDDEIVGGLKEDILFFTVESEQELQRISECAARLGVKGRVALRVNPDVDPKTHKYISTGKKENKFGMDIGRALRDYEAASKMPGIEIAGLHMHIGSQILSSGPFAEAIDKVADVCRKLKATYPTFQYLDIGGGIGIRYKDDERPLDPKMFAHAVVPVLKPLGLKIVMEPGRFLVGNAGILVARVQYVKDGPSKKFVIVDAAMNDLIRPPLYQAHHDVVPVRPSEKKVLTDVVGPICESADFFALDRELPEMKQGDLVAVMSAGAYGFSMSSNYNSRGRAPEIMVSGSRAEVVRRRETIDDVMRGEITPKW